MTVSQESDVTPVGTWRHPRVFRPSRRRTIAPVDGARYGNRTAASWWRHAFQYGYAYQRLCDLTGSFLDNS
ncbi:hypothetical protein ACFVXC_18255 [Streptomyces sp. NPDC058257]|uniref:hypothetical protein n=1 Tax=Streptomyces sp. NPDC058257 TaxID=3346409 RepID=UPI0036E4B5D1